MKEKTKEKKPLDSIAILIFMVVEAAVLSWIIPAGIYERLEVGGQMVVDPSSFHFVDVPKILPVDILNAIPNGMVNASGMIFVGLLMGGGLECIQGSGALNIGISRIIQKLGVKYGNVILIVLFYIFALLGGFLGFIEGSIPFIPIAISIAIALGYDSVVGVAIAIVGAVSGFFCGPTNMLTVGISQNLVGLPLYSGFGLRIALFVIIPTIALVYILIYAERTKKNPEKSLMYGVDVSDLAFDVSKLGSETFTWKHAVIIISLLTGILMYVYGAVNLGWGMYGLGSVFVLLAIIAGIMSGWGANQIVENFVRGASGMVSACFIMGTAYGIAWVFNKASVLDTIVYYLSQPLNGLSPLTSVIGILVVIMMINLLIPSGSGKALIVMPIVFPIAQIVGIESQVAILAYQFGDGITNLCTPLCGVVLLALSFGRVPFSKWERFILPLIAIFFILACVTLVIAMKIGYC